MSPTNASSSSLKISSIKVSFNGELRRFPFPIDESVDQFAIVSQTIAQSFGIATSSLVLQYVDEENDTITIGSQLELVAAMATASSPILRLNATSTASSSSASAPAASASPAATASSSASPQQQQQQQPPSYPFHHYGGAHPHAHGHPHGHGGHAFHHGHRGFGGFGAFGGQHPQHPHPNPHHQQGGFGGEHQRPHHPFGGRGSWGARRGGAGGCGGRNKHGENLQEQYKTQLEELEREGLNCGFWAVRILANLNGDVEATKNVIRTRKAAMNDLRTKYAMQLEALESMGLIPSASSDAATTTTTTSTEGGRCGRGGSDQGAHNHCTRKCIRLLERFNGDVEQVADHIRQKQAERESLPVRYASQLNQLREQGFWCEPICLRMLHKFDGDVAKAAERMSKFRKSMPHHQQQQGEQEASNKQYESELQSLVAKGYSRWSSARLLRKFDGDASRVERALDTRKQWFNSNLSEGGMRDKRQEFKEAKARFSNEIKQLKEMGFRCKWLMVPALLRHNGDVAAASLEL